MKIGKLSNEELQKIIFDKVKVLHEDVRVSSSIGSDCAVLNFGSDDIVVSTDPITATSKNLGKLIVNINANDIAAASATPIALLVTMLLPSDETIKNVERIVDELLYECEALGITLVGGHTEVTDSVNEIILSATCIGKRNVSIYTPKVGDKLIMTKYAALEGSSILANEYANKLASVLTNDEICIAQSYINMISVLPESSIANGSVMHDVTEGGIYGAAWELANTVGLGVQINTDSIPITAITTKICEYFGIDVYRLISSGSMLIVSDNEAALVNELRNANIDANIIGELTSGAFEVVHNGVVQKLESPKEDEIYKISSLI